MERMLENIVLIGFMGSGKSTLGRALSKKSGLCLLDTDSILETNLDQNVQEVFEKQGEQFWRNIESSLASWLTLSVQNAIIATGGGMPIYSDISNMGKIFYLKIGFDELLKRLDKDQIQKRPLLKDLKKAHKIYSERHRIYSDIANFTLDANRSTEELVHDIYRFMQNEMSIV